MEGKAAATPLRIYSQGNITHEVFDANDEPFAMIKATKEKAAFIVRACNAHDDLVKALKDLYSAVDSCVDLTPELMLQASAALKKAGAA